VTTAVRLFSAGARTDQVKAVTGHYSDRAVQTYNRIRPLQQLATSGVIQKNLLSKKNENKKMEVLLQFFLQSVAPEIN